MIGNWGKHLHGETLGHILLLFVLFCLGDDGKEHSTYYTLVKYTLTKMDFQIWNKHCKVRMIVE